MSDELPRYPFRVRWWENNCSYAAARDKSGWRNFYEKEASSVRWFEIPSTPQLVARAEASLAEGKHIIEIPAAENDLPPREIQFYSCFISYSTKDQTFAERLYADLKIKGVNCWFAPHDAKSGVKLIEQIDKAIRIYDRLLLILSEHSINSRWVKTEIAHARQRELTEGRQVLFPVGLVPFETIREWKCFDADTGRDTAAEIREYFIPDFSDWKRRDSYRKAFERLACDLEAQK